MRLTLRVAAILAGLALLRAAPLSVEAVRRALALAAALPRLCAAGAAACGSRIEGEPLQRQRAVRRQSCQLARHPRCSAAPRRSVFVARAEVADWPVVGWVAGLNDTIYVARDVPEQRQRPGRRAARGAGDGPRRRLFPEGTTEGGRELLPFRAEPVRLALPAARRRHGAAGRARLWRRRRRRRLGRRRDRAAPTRSASCRGPARSRSTLRFLAPIDPAEAGDRKALAARRSEEIVAGARRFRRAGAIPYSAPR